MTINIDYFIKDLYTFNPIIRMSPSAKKDIEGVELYENDKALSKETTLYLLNLNRDDLHTLPNNISCNLIIFTNAPDKVKLSDLYEHNVLIMHCDDYISVTNKCLMLMNQWHNDQMAMSNLYNTLNERDSIDKILDQAYQYLGNPIFIRDRHFKLLGFTQNAISDDYVWNREIVEKKYQSYRSFQQIMKRGLLAVAASTRLPIYFEHCNDPSIYSSKNEEIPLCGYQNRAYLKSPILDEDERIKYSRLWVNILDQNRVIGQVVLIESNKQLCDRDILFLQAVTDVIAIAMKRNVQYMISETTSSDRLFTDILKGDLIDTESINERQKFIGTDVTRPKQVIVLTLPTSRMTEMALNYIKGFFNNTFRSLACFLYQQHIVVIINNAKLRKSQLDALNQFLTDTRMICGISRTFSSLTDLTRYYNQAMAAKNAIKNPSEKVKLYDESRLHHMLDICDKNSNLRDLCHPGIFKLMAFDSDNGTDHVQLLQAHIMMLKKQGELAAYKHLHRNTLYYRLRKIEGIMGASLDNPEDFFSIYLSYKALEYLGEISPLHF